MPQKGQQPVQAVPQTWLTASCQGFLASMIQDEALYVALWFHAQAAVSRQLLNCAPLMRVTLRRRSRGHGGHPLHSAMKGLRPAQTQYKWLDGGSIDRGRTSSISSCMRMHIACMDREGGQGGSALASQISQAGWTDVVYLSISSAHQASRLAGMMNSPCLVLC